MSRKAKSCVLRCPNGVKKTIALPDNKRIYLGRCKEATITDPAVSRKQVALTADYTKYFVVVEALGLNHSGCNGYALRKRGKYNLKHGDRLELRIGFHEYDIDFHPVPNSPDNNSDNEPAVEPVRKKAKTNVPTVSNNSNENGPDISCEWESIDAGELLIYTGSGVKSQVKVASFDLDGTLIKTKSGARFAKTPDDWTLNFSEIPKKLKELHQDNHKIVLFTNQGGVKSDQGKVQQLKKKIEHIAEQLKVPFQAFVATSKSIYRKPAPGMWNALTKEKNDGVIVDLSKSFYVGDAAGRNKNWAPKKPKDHSIADRLFAINVGLKFYTPEEYFLGARVIQQYATAKFDPRQLQYDLKNISVPINNSICEVIIMVGGPGSGKSFYCKENLIKNGYAYANRDSLGSWQACAKLLEESLQRKQSVIIDNTNRDKVSRKRYIELAKKYDAPCRCFMMTTSALHAKHNNRFREITDKNHLVLGDVILNMYAKNYEEPTIDEGFKEIVKIDFVPTFSNAEHERLYRMFLLEL